MVSNPYDNGTNGPEDDSFDDLEFVEDDFSHEGYEEGAYDLEGDIDASYSDEDFGDEEWDEEGADASHAQEKLYQSAGAKKRLSFNTIVIIGAVVVGGAVMLMTVKNKSAEVSAGNQGFFQSMLNIGGVMDGMLLGDKGAPSQDSGTPGEGEASGGFLNDPSLFSADTDSSPPQPTPMAPQEDDADYPLTAMPDGYYDTPRGPDEQAPQTDIAEPAVADAASDAPVSAEDLLKQALANREKKQQEKTAAPEQKETAPLEADNQRQPAQQQETAPVDAPPVTPAPAIATSASTPVNVPVPDTRTTEALAQNTQAMEALGSRMGQLLGRISSIEGDIKSMQASGKEDYGKLEKTITALQAEVQKLKERPAVAAQAPAAPKNTGAASSSDSGARKAVETKSSTPSAPKAAAPAKPKSPSTPARQQAAPAAQGGNWELRAAQPGRAWVSRGGSRDMQSVEVGQTLAGIGRVTAISYQGGRWTVVGTQGQIRQ